MKSLLNVTASGDEDLKYRPQIYKKKLSNKLKNPLNSLCKYRQKYTKKLKS